MDFLHHYIDKNAYHGIGGGERTNQKLLKLVFKELSQNCQIFNQLIIFLPLKMNLMNADRTSKELIICMLSDIK